MTDSCINLASIEERNIRKLIPRVIAPSTSTPSAPASSEPVPSASVASTSTATKLQVPVPVPVPVRKCRASYLSQLESSNYRYTRSRKSIAVPEDVFDGGVEDTIVVRKHRD